MAIQATVITRQFSYNGMKLSDPSPGKTPQQVLEFYARQFSELTNAVIEGPATKGAIATYKFMRAVGSKGHTTS